MNAHFVLTFVIFLILFYLSSQEVVEVNDPWLEHKSKYSLSFSVTEDQKRKEIFEKNLLHIQKTNAANLTFHLEMNHFGHMTKEEVLREFNSTKSERKLDSVANYKVETESNRADFTYPESWDWRDKGIVSPIKNQGHCGSYWAFSTTGAMEAHYRMKYKKTKIFSEQQVVDCNHYYRNFGCDGGYSLFAYEYAREWGLVTEEEYPYIAEDGRCKFWTDPAKPIIGTKIRGFHVLAIDEVEVTKAIYRYGPVSVGFYANDQNFIFYKGGIYMNDYCKNDPKDANFAALAVGYGRNNLGREYYIVKNSWSVNWGEHGYIRMIRNHNNNCGIASFAMYPDM